MQCRRIRRSSAAGRRRWSIKWQELCSGSTNESPLSPREWTLYPIRHTNHLSAIPRDPSIGLSDSRWNCNWRTQDYLSCFDCEWFSIIGRGLFCQHHETGTYALHSSVLVMTWPGQHRDGPRTGWVRRESTFPNGFLRLEISGPKEDHLSVIDVPGIFKRTTSRVTTKCGGGGGGGDEGGGRKEGSCMRLLGSIVCICDVIEQ